MNAKTAKILCELNNDFYRDHHAAFSATRNSPWPGWSICLDVLKEAQDSCRGFSLFDLACGNLRFETFLASAFPQVTATFYAVDNCDALVAQTPQAPPVHYQSLDVLGLLLQGQRINDHLQAPLCDISVSFGFMHHVPLRKYREAILQSLIDQTRPGGYVVVSFWQFLDNRALSDKARITHEHALAKLGLPQLDENDCLLGWQDLAHTYRYCHSFPESEIDRLVGLISPRARQIARFSSDGRTENLNTYVILKVPEASSPGDH